VGLALLSGLAVDRPRNVIERADPIERFVGDGRGARLMDVAGFSLLGSVDNHRQPLAFFITI
jgi:hypothetical protein